MIGGLSRANHLLELCLLVEEPRADPWKENEENQKGDDCLPQEHELEMISSVDVRDQKMPARSAGGLPPEEEQADLPSGDGLAPHSGGAGLPEEEADPLGEGTEVGEADHA